MVESGSSEVELSSNNSTCTRPDNQNRCLSGRMGCLLRGVRSGGLWSREEQEMHINVLKLLAVTLAVKSFAKNRNNIEIMMTTDNSTAMAYINHLGGTHSSVLNELVSGLWRRAMERNIFLRAEHLPRVMNIIADKESRMMRDRCDWMIYPKVFVHLQETMGPLEVDMFASRLTHQLPRFSSWRPDLLAKATVAFPQRWRKFQGYVNPPCYLLLTTLSKTRQQEAQVLLIAPVWKTKPWYSLVLEILVDFPLLLPREEDLVISPTEKEFIMPAGVPQLAAWPVSGNNAEQNTFQKRLLGYSDDYGEEKRHQIMNQSSRNRVAGVRRGIEIPFRDRTCSR